MDGRAILSAQTEGLAMAKTENLTLQVLKQIRDEIVATRSDLGARIDGTNQRIDGTNGGLLALESKVDALAHRQTESELRLATEVVAVARAVEGVRELLRERLDDRDRIDDHERRLAALERGAPGH